MNASQEHISPNISSQAYSKQERVFAKDFGSNVNIIVPDSASENNQRVIPCNDVRAGLVWPTEISPGYYCIFGQKPMINDYGKYPLMFIIERKFELPRDMYMSIMKDSKLFTCKVYYNDLKPENMDLVSMFYDFCRYQRATTISIDKAPLVGKFHIGIRIIQEWWQHKSLEFEDSEILKNQLQTIQRPHLDENVEKEFYAIRALTFIISSIEKTPWKRQFNVVDSEAMERARQKADPMGWT